MVKTGSESKIRVLIVDDHPLLREGIATVLSGEPDMELLGQATNGQEAIDCFARLRPDVTLMDLQMPVMGGIDAIVAIRKQFPGARFVILTTYQGDIQALRAFQAGASGYLLKSMVRQELLDTIRIVHAGGRRIPPEIAVELAEHVADGTLSDREVEILRRVASGAPNKIIAAELSVAETTIKAHVSNILFKLGASDRTHAVTIAIKRGYIDC